ncbi:MAG: methyltransferase domain-containing protein [Saprospiraceae bacterium]|nr:methyltransferase domain-containing protein [Saprospiraceae bacterium]
MPTTEIILQINRPEDLSLMSLSPFQAFIWQHRDDDPRQLALSAHKYPDIQISAASAQVQALQKIQHKIPSWYQPGMDFPLAISLEQASSETTARFKAGLFSGKKIADLTGGLGVDSFFFAQQFDSLTYVEQNPELLAAAQHNFAQLGVTNVHFEHSSAENFLEKTPESFDLIYLDPARRDERKGKVFQLADCSPDVLKIRDLMLKKSPRVLLKTAPLLDLKLAASQLGQVSKIWVVASDGDCREVLYLLERDAPAIDQIPIMAVSLESRPVRFENPTELQIFNFSLAEEQETEASFSAPQNFLYEPNPAILKAGAFRSFGKKFDLSKLHPNTHLYTSFEFKSGLPARCFVIEQVCKYDRKAVQAHVTSGKANITCRNFPDNPDQVRRKLGLADGGDVYLFAATDIEVKKVIMVCRKM